MVPLCGECGEAATVGQHCAHCKAPPSEWRIHPRTQRALDDDAIRRPLRVFTGLFFGAFGALAVYVAWYGRMTMAERFAALVASIVCFLIAYALFGTLRARTDRWWSCRHADGGSASAHTRAERVVEGQGAGPLLARPVEVPALSVTGLEAFAHYGAVRRGLFGSLGLDLNTARVDVGLVVALLSLAARGRVELRAVGRQHWSRGEDGVARSEVFDHYEVRALDVPASSTDPDPLASLLLGALARPAGDSPSDGGAPYRTAVRSPDEPWRDVSQVLAAHIPRQGDARRLLRARFEALLPEASIRPPEDVTAELVATLRGLGGRSVARNLARAVSRGFA